MSMKRNLRIKRRPLANWRPKGDEDEDSMDVDEKKSEDKKKTAGELEAEVENEDLSNLERAWEVLEVAKVIYTRMMKKCKNEQVEKKL